ncbi:MAG: NAD(+) kinase [Gammaproteobacteria bacterium]|nr:NAD(+) kinase [Gammaproteobacteria bacterium]
MSFESIGIIGKFSDASVADAIRALAAHFEAKGATVLLDVDTAALFPDIRLETASREEIGRRCDLAVILGGDGTLLNAARSLADHDVPLAGINLGHLGFLTDISPGRMIECMDQILRGDYRVEERFLLACSVVRAGTELSRGNAFNEVAVHKRNAARMIELETYINGRYLNKQRSDGLIVSTPTGSTAYALSAGGPILDPTLDAIVVVPVCPHTMSHRPIVVDGASEIEVIVGDGNRDHAQVTCDGQVTFPLSAGDRVRIRKQARPVRLVRLPGYDHYELLRAKLNWAENPQNR